MEPDRDLVDAAMRSFIGSYRMLVDHVDGAAIRDFGRVTAFTTGAPISIFNGVIVDEPPEPEDLDAALDWVSGARKPYNLWVPSGLLPGLLTITDRRRMKLSPWLVPHMVLAPTSAVPRPAPGVEIRPVTDAASGAAFRGVLAATGVPVDVAASLFPDPLLLAADVRAFIGELDGSPVGTALAIRTDTVAGVYGVGVLASARRRGVGTAATWAAVEAARAWGSRVVALQSTELGAGVYTAMGFRTVALFAELSPARE